MMGQIPVIPETHLLKRVRFASKQVRCTVPTLCSGLRREATFTCCIHCYDLSFIPCCLHFPDLLRASSLTPVPNLLKNVLFFLPLQSFLVTSPYLSWLLMQLLLKNACFKMLLKKYSNSAFKTDKNFWLPHSHRKNISQKCVPTKCLGRAKIVSIFLE